MDVVILESSYGKQKSFLHETPQFVTDHWNQAVLTSFNVKLALSEESEKLQFEKSEEESSQMLSKCAYLEMISFQAAALKKILGPSWSIRCWVVSLDNCSSSAPGFLHCAERRGQGSFSSTFGRWWEIHFDKLMHYIWYRSLAFLKPCDWTLNDVLLIQLKHAVPCINVWKGLRRCQLSIRFLRVTFCELFKVRFRFQSIMMKALLTIVVVENVLLPLHHKQNTSPNVVRNKTSNKNTAGNTTASWMRTNLLQQNLQ